MIHIKVCGDAEQMIQEQLSSGKYATPEEVVEDAVRRLAGTTEKPAKPQNLPRQGGQWRGRVSLADDFDELPDDLQKAFGIGKP